MVNQAKTNQNSKLVKAYARQLRIAPRKIRLVTNAVKGMYVSDALVQLEHMNKKAAPMVSKLLKSALANATNNFSMNADWMSIKSLTADAGPVLKRYFPRARGSAFTIRRKLTSLNVVLEEKKRGASTARSAFLSRFIKKKEEEKPQTTVADEQPKTVAEIKDNKPKAVKTDEQRKLNKVQQKRRLFTRKTGE